MKLWIIVAAFLIIGGFLIVKAHDIQLENPNERTEFMYRFASWTYDLGMNVKDTVGYAVKLNWLPEGGNESGNHS